jgi:hypothetical protein
MRHKKRTIHKYKNRNKPTNKHNKTRKNPFRNTSKHASQKYTRQHRKTIKIKGGSDVLAKAYGAVQKGLSSVGSVFTPVATQPEQRSRDDIMAHMNQLIQTPMPTKKFTNAEYGEMIKFQRRFIDSVRGIRNSKTKPPSYTIIITLLHDIVAFNRLMTPHKHYDFLIGYYPSTSENYGLKIIDFSAGDNQLPRVMKLYVKSNQFIADYAVEGDNDDAKGIPEDIFDEASYLAGIDNDTIYNYNPTLIGMLDAIYYCIPDKSICLELTRRLHGVDPHIVERVSPLTWTTPLCTAISFLEDKKVIVELMELIKSNQLMQKALFRYYRDSYYPEIHADQFRENGIKLIGDRVESVKLYLLMKNMISVGSNPDGSANVNAIIIRNSTKYMYDLLSNFWEKYKGYIIKYCVEWYEPGLPMAISRWLGDSISGYIAEIKEQERVQNMSEVELLAQFEEDTPKADNKGSKKAQPKPQAQPKKKTDKDLAEEEARKKVVEAEKERVRFEQARLRAEAEERKRVAAEAEAERKRVADEAQKAVEAERKRVADEEKKAAKAAKRAQKKTEEALAATATAEAEEARAREKQRLSARTPPFFEAEPEKYSKMEESSQETLGASQSIEMEDTRQFRSIAEPIPVGPKVAYIYPDLSALRMLGVNPDVVIASTMSLLQPYIDSGNITGVCGLITSKLTNYTLQSNMYYNLMSCVTFIIIGQLTNLLKTTKYRLILKGSKALQVSFANTIDTKPYLISDDIDILLVPADREDIKRNPIMYEDSGIVAGDICSMIEWIIKSALPPGLSTLVSVLNPMKQYARNPNVFKISHLEPNGKLSVIADIDIRYTKNTAMIFSQEDEHLSRIGFPVMSEDQSFDVFYNPSRMFYTTIDIIPNIQLLYLHQTIDAAFEEKIYYYIKYILLKTPYNDNSFLIDKFKKSIMAILNYNYFMIPQARRKKFMNYSEGYITDFLSPYPNKKYYLNLVLSTLFAGKGAGGL